MVSASVTADDTSRSEQKTLAIVCTVHLVSHFYWLAFVPLLPALKELLNVSFVELGFAITLMNVISALTQAPTGFIVDRLGARRMLVIGVLLGTVGFVMIGLVPTYPVLLAGAALIGLANAVYHPADYSILAAEMNPQRMGRAFSIHSFAGYLGFALAPPILLGAVQFGGVRFALLLAGVLGALSALPLIPGMRQERKPANKENVAAAPQSSARSLVTPSVLMLTLMFATLNVSTATLQTYMVVSLETLHGVARGVASTALTIWLFGLVGGILAGGFLADRVRRQSLVTSGGLALSALFVVVVGVVALPTYAMLAAVAIGAFLSGIIIPSRDMLVRGASPAGAVGRVFGIVTTGFNFGGMIAPLVGGYLIDHGLPLWVYFVSALFMMASVAVAIVVDRQAASAAKPIAG
jgi:FSR family fosmidomycin resistance protein-like MFS transporter